MKLKALSLTDLEQVRLWRNENLSALRTPFLLTAEQQEAFYLNTICNRQANSQYWGIWGDTQILYADDRPIDGAKELIGMCGLENIQWENRLAEISMILNPDYRGKGYGGKAVALLLDQGFNYLNLENIYGECYFCNPAVEFWKTICKRYGAKCCNIPNRKYWNGQYYDSLYFNIARER